MTIQYRLQRVRNDFVLLRQALMQHGNFHHDRAQRGSPYSRAVRSPFQGQCSKQIGTCGAEITRVTATQERRAKRRQRNAARQHLPGRRAQTLQASSGLRRPLFGVGGRRAHTGGEPAKIPRISQRSVAIVPLNHPLDMDTVPI
ncbi:hypothetical protein D3C71_1648580 [compost metagenome]